MKSPTRGEEDPAWGYPAFFLWSARDSSPTCHRVAALAIDKYGEVPATVLVGSLYPEEVVAPLALRRCAR
jgi:hypothetical protein